MEKQKSREKEIGNGPKYVEIPRGWTRILENGSILYIRYANSMICFDLFFFN